MLLVNAVTLACLILIIFEIAASVAAIAFSGRGDRISFIRSFKKGKFAIIYATAFPLYYVAHTYVGEGILEAFFSTVNEIKGLVTLEYETDGIKLLMSDSYLFRFTVYLCFIVATVNAFMFAVSIFNQHLWERYQRYIGNVTKKDKLYIFGANGQSVNIYNSDKKRFKILVDDIGGKQREELYLNNIRYAPTSAPEKFAAKLIKDVLKKKCSGIAVINTGDDDKNIAICNSFACELAALNDAQREELFSRLDIYVFGDTEYESIYEDIIKRGYGCMHYLSKHRMVAIDFVDKYPISRFLTNEQVDHSTSLVNDDVDINVFLVGFGRTNRQIFLTSIANNQLLCGTSERPEPKQITYHIFDKEDPKMSKMLNHGYYRFENEFINADSSEYLPLPSAPAIEKYYCLDYHSPDFYSTVRETLRSSRNAVNIAVVAVRDDLENIDIAAKLSGKSKEWDEGTLTVFVKASDHTDKQIPLDAEGCIFIGNEKEVVYNIDKIFNDKISDMARKRNEIYDLEYEISHSKGANVDAAFVEGCKKASDKNWYVKKSLLERESNIYCCLSLRSKLQLMGLDYCEKGTQGVKPLTREQYLSRYGAGDMPSFEDCSITGKPVARYSLDFPISRRRNMAVLEHHRWNSFMLSKGMVPSTKDQILNERTDDKKRYTNGKMYSVRRHGNITTFEGLEEFARMVAERDGVSMLDTDVIKYDYQILDDAYWLLTSNGYEIIEKQ